MTNAVGSLTAADLSWANGLMLSPEEIRLGNTQPVDFLEQDGERWLLNMTQYLEAVCPGLMPYWKLGFVGWMEKPMRPSLPRFMALGYGFEAIYRVTVHLMGFGVLQRSRQAARGILKTQYKMLDARPTGICTEPVLDRLVRHFPPDWKETAKRIVRLAIQARNAIAHGAVLVFDDQTSDGLGHILVKAGQTLATAGLHHMVSERAYYRWSGDGARQGRDQEHWFLAEREIMTWVATVANVPRMADVEPLSPFR